MTRKKKQPLLAEITSCHGVRDLAASSSNIEKCAWALILFACGTFLALQLYAFGTDVLSAKWTTRSYINKVQEPLKFPNIFVCNFNNFRASKMAELNMSDTVLSYLNAYFAVVYPFEKQNNVEGEKSAAEEYKKWSKDIGMDYWQMFTYMTHQCNDTILAIKYLDTYTDMAYPCEHLVDNTLFATDEEAFLAFKDAAASQLIIRILHETYGICYLVEGGYDVDHTGEQSGIYMMLNAETHEYPSVLENQPLTEGFRIQLSHGPFDGKVPLTLAPGFHAWVSMTQWRHHATEDSALHVFERPCIYQREMRPNVIMVKYAQDSCYEACMLDAIMVDCGCCLNSQFGARLCEPWEFSACIHYNRTHLPSMIELERTHAQRSVDCAFNCRPLCDRMGVVAHVHYGIMPTRKQRAIDINGTVGGLNITADDFGKNIASMNIYYSTLDVDELEYYEMYTLDNIVSRIGGLLGVWIGASIITIIQAVFYACHAIGRRIHGGRK